MNPMISAARTGLVRGAIELRQTFTNGQDLWGYFFPTVLMLGVLVFLHDITTPGTTFSLGAQSVPGTIGITIAFGGLATTAVALVTEREDGTLLRAKATPHGITSYLVGKVVQVSGITAVCTALILVPSLFMFDGFALGSVGTWLTLAWVLTLGLVATMPIGAILGSLLSSPRNSGLIMFPTIGLFAISGIFYPITITPAWLQGIAQVFPIYWLGLGARSALLPDGMAAAEIGESWRHLETLGVLGAWAVFGMVVAPVVLRRMARRESGSSVAARRQKAMQRAV
ncbi:ABC transporter permease [Micromonospora sp. NPDC003197]